MQKNSTAHYRNGSTTVPEQIQVPTQLERLSVSFQGKKLRRATGQDSQASVYALEGKTPLGMAHRPS